MTKQSLAAKVKKVPNQKEVYATDLKAAKERKLEKPKEAAIDGLAHYVFNTLRGADDHVDGATFEHVRAIVAKGIR